MTNDALTARADLDRLNAELLATWRATNSLRTTGRQMQRLYARAAELRAEIDALEAAIESGESLTWPAER